MVDPHQALAACQLGEYDRLVNKFQSVVVHSATSQYPEGVERLRASADNLSDMLADTEIAADRHSHDFQTGHTLNSW